MNKRKIIIIEDVEEHWKKLYSMLRQKYDVYPERLDQFKALRGQLAAVYGEGTEDNLIEKNDKLIKATISDFAAELCLVDYELMEGNEMCNGIRFSEDYLFNKIILFITGVKGENSDEIRNKIKEHCEGIGPGTNTGKDDNQNHVDFLFKEKMNEDFRVRLMRWLAKFFKSNDTDDDERLDPNILK
ncbi:hypothetical protein BEL04_08635 [Mucilaginibacter sp. PPCGB 2223]|uniref:hypothetical protein n=1 Tax=Mucilaginibacter sp. PPCGB 2223 TaxID=1886027 RepID=UPI0008250DE9|nr:hypothetical protein [Mucilaginibacter sp. PPCGB 2223]OCX54315.1 hypothetical protein BEL04_08635 [Mucilaginibacter sp. PPCGB 2223]